MDRMDVNLEIPQNEHRATVDTARFGYKLQAPLTKF